MDQKSLETVFSIAICCQSDDKWQSKSLFLAIFDICSSKVLEQGWKILKISTRPTSPYVLVN